MALVQLASDNFNRADSAPMSGNWGQVNGGALGSRQLNIQSNAVIVNGFNQASMEYYNGITWPNDQYSEAACVVPPAQQAGVLVRLSSSAVTFYYLICKQGITVMGKAVAGVYADLAQYNTAANPGDVFRLEVIGSNLTAYRNTVSILTATDSSIASGNAGLFMVAASTATTLDNWAGGGTPFGGGAQAGAFLVGL